MSPPKRILDCIKHHNAKLIKTKIENQKHLLDRIKKVKKVKVSSLRADSNLRINSQLFDFLTDFPY